MKLFFLILTFICTESFAQSRLRPRDPPNNRGSVYNPQIELETPLFSGTVCSQGNNSVTLSPDKKSISILFDQFATQVGADIGVLIARELCRMRIPVKVPPGMQMTIVKTDTRGFNSLPIGAKSEISTIHHLVDRFSNRMLDRTPHKQQHVFNGPLDEEFIIGNHIETDFTWSACGKDLILNIGLQATVSTTHDTALTVIDSLDLNASEKTLDYHLLWRTCNDGNTRPTRPVRPIGR
jgi:hypothetical protein